MQKITIISSVHTPDFYFATKKLGFYDLETIKAAYILLDFWISVSVLTPLSIENFWNAHNSIL